MYQAFRTITRIGRQFASLVFGGAGTAVAPTAAQVCFTTRTQSAVIFTTTTTPAVLFATDTRPGVIFTTRTGCET